MRQRHGPAEAGAWGHRAATGSLVNGVCRFNRRGGSSPLLPLLVLHRADDERDVRPGRGRERHALISSGTRGGMKAVETLLGRLATRGYPLDVV